MVRISACLAAAMIISSVPAAGQPRVYAGGTFALRTQTHGNNEPIGGTSPDGSVLFGVWVSPRVAIEVEPAFGPTYSGDYTYHPGPSLTASVVTSRRDTFLAFQVRTRLGPVQPVAGAGYDHGHTTRHATFTTGQTYFHDESSENAMFLTAGADVPFRVAPHLEIFPTLRLLFAARNEPVALIPSQTATGSVTVRYGAGARILF
jgi:hypothetical protein